MSIKVLCPIDLSPCAASAAEMAAELVKGSEAEFDLLYITEVPVLALPEGPIRANAEWVSVMQQTANDQLHLQRQTLERRGYKVRSHVLAGSPASVITSHAEATKPDLIAMGTHGRTGFKRMVMGSVAERIVRTASVPVLTVRQPDTAPGSSSRTATGPIHRILVAYDFSDPAERALRRAGELAQKLGASLHVVHVHVDMYQAKPTPAAVNPWPSAEQADRYVMFLREELCRMVETVVPELAGRVQCKVLRGDPVKELEAAADELRAELICVGSSGKGAVQRVLLGSVAQLLVRTSVVPVLNVH